MPVNGLSDRFEFSIPREMLLPLLSKMASFAYFFLFLPSFLPFFLSFRSFFFARHSRGAEEASRHRCKKQKRHRTRQRRFFPHHASTTLQRSKIHSNVSRIISRVEHADLPLYPSIPQSFFVKEKERNCLRVRLARERFIKYFSYSEEKRKKEGRLIQNVLYSKKHRYCNSFVKEKENRE